MKTAALGEGSGWLGPILASLAGSVTPAGPLVSMPLAAGLLPRKVPDRRLR